MSDADTKVAEARKAIDWMAKDGLSIDPGVLEKIEAAFDAQTEEMSMRDFFAAAALQGFVAHRELTSAKSAEEIARDSYECADALLAIRDSETPSTTKTGGYGG